MKNFKILYEFHNVLKMYINILLFSIFFIPIVVTWIRDSNLFSKHKQLCSDIYLYYFKILTGYSSNSTDTLLSSLGGSSSAVRLSYLSNVNGSRGFWYIEWHNAITIHSDIENNSILFQRTILMTFFFFYWYLAENKNIKFNTWSTIGVTIVLVDNISANRFLLRKSH